ncbi:MAG: class I SAM-dependent methyltransferase [Pseudomonadota bacterium]
MADTTDTDMDPGEDADRTERRDAAATDSGTVAFYDANAEDYAQAAQTEDGIKHLALFAADLPAGARVLDLGAGEGWASGWMAGEGFDVLAYDASEALLTLAAARPGVRTALGTFEDMDGHPDLEPGFDGVWASFSLLHAPRAALPDHLDTIAALLVPGGRFFLGLKGGTGEARDRLGRRYSYFSAEELIDALGAAGFDILQVTSADGRGMTGATEAFLYLHARRAA